MTVRLEEYRLRFLHYLAEAAKVETKFRDPVVVEATVTFHPERGWQFNKEKQLAHRLSFGEIQRSGSHWCNWSVASTCSRWRANGGKSYGLGCTGPHDMRSGCRARGLR
jgi:hypothetical protein